jgi:hypothetical protein
MTMTNAQRQAAYRARQKLTGQRPLPDRTSQLEIELAKLKVRIERLELRVKNQTRRRPTQSSLEPAEVARNAFQVRKYIQTTSAAGRLPSETECMRRTGLTRSVVRYHWPPKPH